MARSSDRCPAYLATSNTHGVTLLANCKGWSEAEIWAPYSCGWRHPKDLLPTLPRCIYSNIFGDRVASFAITAHRKTSTVELALLTLNPSKDWAETQTSAAQTIRRYSGDSQSATSRSSQKHLVESADWRARIYQHFMVMLAAFNGDNTSHNIPKIHKAVLVLVVRPKAV